MQTPERSDTKQRGGGKLVRLLPGNQLQWTMESLTAAGAKRTLYRFIPPTFSLPVPPTNLEICNLITLTAQLTQYGWKKVSCDGTVS